jgi:hypothetical protein
VVGATGRAMVFAVEHTEYDRREGDLRWWVLVPVRPADRALVAKLTLWND